MMNSNRILCLLFLILLAPAAGRLTAQEAPSDSAALQKPEPAEPLLELPEILIIGPDAYHRLVDAKKNLTLETPQALTLPNSYETAAVAPQKRLAAAENPFPTLYALLQGGSTFYLSGLAGYHYFFENGQIIANATFERSDGHYRNSRTAEGGLRIHGNYRINEKTRLFGTAAYERWGYGLQSTGYRRADAVRRGGRGSFHALLDYQHSRELSAGLDVEFGGMAMQSDTAQVNIESSSDFFSRLQAKAQFSRGRMQLEGKAGYLHENYQDTGDQLLDLGDLQLRASGSVSKAVSVTIGAKLASFFADTASGSRFSPMAAVVFAPSERFACSLKIDGGLTPLAMTDYQRENLFIAHSAAIRPQEDKQRLQGDWQLAVSSAVMVQGGFVRRWTKAMPIFETDSTNNLLDLLWIHDVVVTETRLGLKTKFSRNVEATMALIDYSDDLDRSDLIGAGIPYLPDYRLPMELTAGLPAGTRMNVWAELIGRRRMGIDSQTTLPPRFRMNLRLSKPIVKVAEAFIDCRNLFNDRSYQWQGYREPGLIFSLGLIYRR